LALLVLACAALVAGRRLTLLTLARFKAVITTNAATAGVVLGVVLNVRCGERTGGELVFVVVDDGLVATDFCAFEVCVASDVAITIAFGNASINAKTCC
jgi:hypothetical protein